MHSKKNYSSRNGQWSAMSGVGLVTLLLVIAACQTQAQLPPADVPNLYNDTHCGHECIRCAPDGCIKCARLLVWPAGTCANSCPPGTRESWASDDRLMGRVCYPSRAYNEALVGGACGAALCIVLLIAAAAYAKCRSKRPHRQPLPQSRDEDDAKLRDFHKQLDCLRPHAFTLLAILNHTRHQVRELYQLGNNNAAMAYSCVLSDLAKLLILLNKQQVPVVPEEWPRLAGWADKILKRYSRMTVVNQQEGQLVNFLPSPNNADGSSNSTQQSFSTFKPPSYSPSSYNSKLFDKDLDSPCEWSDTGRPPSYSQIEQANETMILSTPWERRPIVRREGVWLEDEMFEMTRRPQDEQTTEL